MRRPTVTITITITSTITITFTITIVTAVKFTIMRLFTIIASAATFTVS